MNFKRHMHFRLGFAIVPGIPRFAVRKKHFYDFDDALAGGAQVDVTNYTGKHMLGREACSFFVGISNGK